MNLRGKRTFFNMNVNFLKDNNEKINQEWIK